MLAQLHTRACACVRVCVRARVCVCVRVLAHCWEETVASPYLDPTCDVDTSPGNEDRTLCMHHEGKIDVQKAASPGLPTVFTFSVPYFYTFASATASWALKTVQFHVRAMHEF